MTQADYVIRRATLSDAAALALLQEATLRETYIGLLPQAMVNALTSDGRSETWRRSLSGEAGHLTTTYVAVRADELVAFGSCGEQRDQSLAAAGYAGEFTAVYVRNSDQRRGLGTALMRAMMQDLAESGIGNFTLWVPRANIPARSLYEQLGGKLISQRDTPHGDGQLSEVAYAWMAAPSAG